MTGQVPWKGLMPAQIICGVAFNDLRLDIPADVHPELQRLMEDCWKKDPEERPDFDQIRERLKPVAMAFVESEAATGAA